MTAGSLPLEIAPSLRLLLVGDTGIGKTTAQALFLGGVPGQIAPTPSTPKPEEQEDHQSAAATDNAETRDEDAGATSTTEKQQQQQQGEEEDAKKKQEEEDRQNGFTQGRVSTLSIPKWLAATCSAPPTTTADLDSELVPAENIVLHDFVGYGQHPNARLAMDKVEAHLTKQYQQTRQLFGPALTPLTTLPNTVTVVDESGAPAGDEDQSASSSQPTTTAASSFLLRLLEGGAYAHTLPDACLYFILYDLKPVDLEFMKRIMHQVNLIPVLAKADTLSTQQLWRAKQRVLKQLEDHQIDFFRFGYDLDELHEMVKTKQAGGPPFALSTAETSSILDGYYSSHSQDSTTTNNNTHANSLRELALAVHSGAHANANSDLALLQTLLLGAKNRLLHQAAAQKFLDRWQSDIAGTSHQPAASSPLPPPTSSGNGSGSGSGGDSHPNTTSDNPHSDTTANGGSTSTTTTTTTTTTGAPGVTATSDPNPTPTGAASSTTTTTTTPANARPLSTLEEEAVAQVVKLSRAQSVMRRSPSIKNFHNGALIQDGPVPSVPAVSTALLNA